MTDATSSAERERIQEHQQRGDAAEALFRELTRRAREE
jgi:hypothetical protein